VALVRVVLAHDDYGDHVEHWRLHRDLSEAHYVRCLSLSGKLAGSLRVASSVLVASSLRVASLLRWLAGWLAVRWLAVQWVGILTRVC
jgi:hypothetical protein